MVKKHSKNQPKAIETARAKVSDILSDLKKQNEALQQKYKGLCASDAASSSNPSVTEYKEKFVEWGVPMEKTSIRAQPDNLSMRWGTEPAPKSSESEEMLKQGSLLQSDLISRAIAGAPTKRADASPPYFAWHPRLEFANITAHDPAGSAGDSIHEQSELENAQVHSLTEQGEKYTWWPIEKVHQFKAPVNPNPICIDASSAETAQWDSETHAAQSQAVAAAAAHVQDRQAVAGVPTRTLGAPASPYFVTGNTHDSAVSEYMENYHKYVIETAQHVKPTMERTNPICIDASSAETAQWDSETHAAQSQAVAAAAAHVQDRQAVAGVPTRTLGAPASPYFVWNVSEANRKDDFVTEYTGHFHAASPDQLVSTHVKPTMERTNPICIDASSAETAQWDSETHAAQSQAVAAAAAHVQDRQAVAGVPTRTLGAPASPYFVTGNTLGGSHATSEYTAHYGPFSPEQMPKHVKAIYIPTNPIGVGANGVGAWESENRASQEAARAALASGVGSRVAGVHSVGIAAHAPYFFAWNPVDKSNCSVSQSAPELREVTEYQQCFRAYSTDVSPKHVKATYIPTNPIGVGANGVGAWESENRASQEAARAALASGAESRVAGIASERSEENLRGSLVWKSNDTSLVSESQDAFTAKTSLLPRRTLHPDHMKGPLVISEADGFTRPISKQTSFTLEVPSADEEASLNTRSSRSSSRSDEKMKSTVRVVHEHPGVKRVEEQSLAESNRDGTVAVSDATVIGDTLTRISSADSACSNMDSIVPTNNTVAASVDSKLGASMAGPLPVRFRSSRFNTEYRDAFSWKNFLEAHLSTHTDVESRPKTAPPAATTSAEVPQHTARSKSAARSEYAASFAWPDPSWYKQNPIASKRGRALSTGRLGMARPTAASLIHSYCDDQVVRSSASMPTSATSELFSTDSLERPKISLPKSAEEAVAPVSTQQQQSSPVSVCMDDFESRDKRNLKPKRLVASPDRSSHLKEKRDIRPSIVGNFGTSSDVRSRQIPLTHTGPQQNPRYNSGSGRISSRSWRTETSASYTWK